MQIPATSSAAQAASVVAQGTSKDKVAENRSAIASHPNTPESTVEKSEHANPDRDAQGQGDGWPGHSRPPIDEIDLESTEEAPVASQPAPDLPGDPPSQLDIVG